MTSPWCHDSYAPSFVINGPKFAKLFNRITAIIPLDFFADFTFAGVKTHKIGCADKRIGPAVYLLVSSAEVMCSNLRHQPKKQHMCLVVGVPVKVKVPCWEVRQQLVFGSSFCGCSSSILEPPDHENIHRKSSFATAILLRRWQMRARSKANEPLR